VIAYLLGEYSFLFSPIIAEGPHVSRSGYGDGLELSLWCDWIRIGKRLRGQWTFSVNTKSADARVDAGVSVWDRRAVLSESWRIS
jgi:hypothetical protein